MILIMSSFENDIMYFLSKYSCLHTNKCKQAGAKINFFVFLFLVYVLYIFYYYIK